MQIEMPFTVPPVENTVGSDRIATQIYTNIRRSIITGDLPQGARLNETKLADALGVSRVPLREALPLLEMNGLIVSLPHRSAQVSKWTSDRINQLFDVRLSIEADGARRAAKAAAKGASMDDLEDTINRADATLQNGTDLEIAEISTLFHFRVIELTGNTLMISLMKTISHQMTWLFYLTSGRDPLVACEEHHELFECIASGDGELAKASMYRHIEVGRKPTLGVIESLQAGDTAEKRRALHRLDAAEKF
jgi:DNA-binding GntR family transcriptional regulator